MIVHEDVLISNRLTALLVAQSFLATAVVILLANHKNASTPDAYYWLALLICGVAILLGVFTDSSITAARLEQAYVKRGSDYEKAFPFGGNTADTWGRCLQSHTPLTRNAGFLLAAATPAMTTLMWNVFVYHCIVQIFSRNAAATVSVVSIVVEVAYFVVIHTRLRNDHPDE